MIPLEDKDEESKIGSSGYEGKSFPASPSSASPFSAFSLYGSGGRIEKNSRFSALLLSPPIPFRVLELLFHLLINSFQESEKYLAERRLIEDKNIWLSPKFTINDFSRPRRGRVRRAINPTLNIKRLQKSELVRRTLEFELLVSLVFHFLSPWLKFDPTFSAWETLG